MAAVAAVLGAATLAAQYAGKITNKQDPARFSQAESWYYAARSGDRDSLCMLKYMSGRYGASPGCGRFGSGASGFATQVAKDYAHALFQQAEGIQNGVVPPSAAPPPKPAPSPNNPLGNFPQQIADASSAAGGVSNALGFPNQQQQVLNLVLLGIAAVAVFVIIRR